MGSNLWVVGTWLLGTVMVSGCNDSSFGGSSPSPANRKDSSGVVDADCGAGQASCGKGRTKAVDSVEDEPVAGGDGDEAEVSDGIDSVEVEGKEAGDGSDVDDSELPGVDFTDVEDDVACKIVKVPVNPALPPTTSLSTPTAIVSHPKIVAGVPMRMGNGVNPRNDATTAGKLCQLLGYERVAAKSGKAWDSPGDNTLVIWNGDQFTTASGSSSNNWLATLTCAGPKTKSREICE